jgi:uncharacterized tellurite resistance protein B-like protein
VVLIITYWQVVLFLAVCGVVFWAIRANITNSEAEVEPQLPPAPARNINFDNFRITVPTGPAMTPRNLTKDGDAVWQPAGKITRIREFEVPGLVYVGSKLASVNGDDLEPALIDPSLPVGSNITECSIRRMNYWPSYRSVSPDARAAYLYWHSTGRKDPNADLGYVFLYFYGLERRILHDARTSESAKAEMPVIQAEIARLLGIYTRSGTFQRYAGELLNFLTLKTASEKIYLKQPPAVNYWNQLTFLHRLGLAQCANDGHPLPAEWAYAWLAGNPNYHPRTPAVRCQKEFKRLFISLYGKRYGDGLVLQKNQTKLKLEYHPATPGFMGGVNLAFATTLPDVSLLSGPIKKLQDIADECCAKLEPFSRYLGKTKEKAGTYEANLKLPYLLWTDNYKKSIDHLKELLASGNGISEISFKKIRELFPEWTELDKETIADFECALTDAGIGLETGLNIGATPTEESKAIIFADESENLIRNATPRYQMTALTMHLGVAVAAADDNIAESERDLLKKQIDNQPLAEPQKKRLHAHLRMLLAEPPKLTGLTKRIAALKKEEKEYIGNSIALVALTDSSVGAAEVKTLEKVFKLLGIDTKQLYSLIHSSATEPITVRPAKAGEDGFALPKPAKAASTFKLDPKKIAALQADSERVAALLAPVFELEPTIAPKPMPEEPAEEASSTAGALVPGLEQEYSDFARSLFSRTEWSRTELEELAQDRGLPLDGVMERVNDAFYDKFEQSLLIEAGSNIEINQEILREVVK